MSRLQTALEQAQAAALAAATAHAGAADAEQLQEELQAARAECLRLQREVEHVRQQQAAAPGGADGAAAELQQRWVGQVAEGLLMQIGCFAGEAGQPRSVIEVARTCTIEHCLPTMCLQGV